MNRPKFIIGQILNFDFERVKVRKVLETAQGVKYMLFSAHGLPFQNAVSEDQLNALPEWYSASAHYEW